MYGLLGEKLGHSFSPQIHSMLGDYEYRLFEVEKNDLGEFIKHGDWNGINVTIPYKKDVMPYLDEISENARKIGSVNTVVRRSDGTLFGDNTDYYGFYYTVKRSGIDFGGKKVLVLGTGGASLAVKAVIADLGARETVSISRSGENNYQNIKNHADADIIVNTTPVGMYPKNLVSPVKLTDFTHLTAVFDIIYNPQKTKLVLDAEKLDIPAFSGLSMLVAQAKRASEIFFDRTIDDGVTEKILKKVSTDMKNIVLVGMPGSGKTSVGTFLAEKTGREFLDTDEETQYISGTTPAAVIKKYGEKTFRKIENEAVCDLCKLSGKVIATGGGVITNEDNFDAVRQNSVVVFINRDISVLPTDNRPLSQSNSLEDMYKYRLPLYRKFCDFEIDGNGTVEEVANRILERIDGEMRKILVINGPNINMLGIREPKIYGKQNYKTLISNIDEWAKELGCEVECFQSNHEGDIVDRIQKAYSDGTYGIVINPAAYTHTSVAILDALKAVGLPAVEIHISDINEREAFRHISYAGLACEEHYIGLGFEGYKKGMEYLVNRE